MAAVNITFPGNLSQVESADDLRAIPTTLLSNGALYLVKALAGIFAFDASAIAPDDGAMIIKPNDRTILQAGRWLKDSEGLAPGAQGPTGPADNTYTSYAAMQASDPTRASARLVGDTDTPPHPDGPYNNPTQTVGGWVAQGADGIAFKAAGVGAVTRTTQAKAGETKTALDYGATALGKVSDLQPIRNLVKAVRRALSDGSRAFAGEARIPSGRYLVNGPLNLAADGPITGLHLKGDNAGSTELVVTTADAAITAAGCSNLTLSNITIRSIDPFVDTDLWAAMMAEASSKGLPTPLYGIALMQSAFKLSHSFSTDATTLRSWKFQNCTFAGLYECFDVSGASMCSEMFFENCQFSQCYRFMDNANNQAVNWNAVNCNWENEGLDLTGTTGLSRSRSTIFNLKKGTFCKWTGGSIISYGPLVRFDLTASEAFEGNSHKLVFDGVRIERVNDGGGCTPLFDRPEDGTYANAGNAPSVELINSTVLLRAGLPPTTENPVPVDILKLWDNFKLLVGGCEFKAARVRGVYSALTAANTGELVIRNTSGLTYYEDTANRASDHVAHSVTIDPDTRGAVLGVVFQQRSRALTTPVSLPIQTLSVCGPTGSLPLGGTTVNLPVFNPHTTLLRLVVRKFAAAGQSLTVELRDQADTTTYATLTAAPGDRFAAGEVNVEVGFQVTAPLMLKFTGTPEIMKGLVYLEYL